MAFPDVVPATQIQAQSQQEWAGQWLKLPPQIWSNDAAKKPSGLHYGLAMALSENIETIGSGVLYAYNAQRLQTATDDALVLFAQDFFGNTLPKKSGESDDSYRARIQQNLFKPKLTRQAITLFVTDLVGQAPRLMSPNNPGDTAAWGWSGWDADLPDLPSRWGNPALAYQGFIITELPNVGTNEGSIPLWGFDYGAAWGATTGVWWETISANFFTESEMDALLSDMVAGGIVLWRKYQIGNFINQTIANAFNVASSRSQYALQAPYSSTPFSVIAQGNWNSTYWTEPTSYSSFNVNASTPSPTAAPWLNYLFSPFSVPGTGSVLVSAGNSSFTLPVPQGFAGYMPVVTPQWNTTVMITSLSNTSVTFEFGTAPPYEAKLSYAFLPPTYSGIYTFRGGETNILIPSELPQGAAAFASPSWNSQVGVQPLPGGVQAYFSTPAPAGASLYWAAMSSVGVQ